MTTTAKTVKQYSIHFAIHVHEKATSYPEVKPIDIKITENLPVNIDPQKYLRARIAEELRRQFYQLSSPIENMNDNAPEEDPLDDGPQF